MFIMAYTYSYIYYIVFGENDDKSWEVWVSFRQKHIFNCLRQARGHRQWPQGSLMCTLGGSPREKQKRKEDKEGGGGEEEEESKTKTKP